MAVEHIMIDCETLGTAIDSTILTIGAVKFDLYGDELNNPQFESFYVRVDIDSCDRLGLTTSDETLAWWAKQSPEAQDEAFSSEDRIDIKDAMNQLHKFCWNSKTFWSHGATFDIVMMEFLFGKLNRCPPWNYYDIRCSRTLFALGIDPKMPKVTAHNALTDAYYQAIGVQNVMRELKKIT